ncbi:hypothetical protein AB832_04975 [Flavobacteriaceae bacterium (ex Bugula neritina AB1)]|nr:hypothetical protein AB832_04975 [Flavobacteriaceae bacterium (ex Bugula neritina AB1)]
MKVNPWAFGGVFLLVSCIWMWNNFELPKFYPFEKIAKVKAIVFNFKFVIPRLPHGGPDQIVYFV